MSPRRALYDAIRAAEAAEVAADTTAAAVESGGGEGGYEWWSPRREAFDTAASRLEQLLHGELLGDLLGDLRFPARTISRLGSHDKRGTQRGGGRVRAFGEGACVNHKECKQKMDPSPGPGP